MANIYRADEVREDSKMVELPLRPNVSAKRSEEGEKKRLMIRAKIAREAVEKTSEARHERDEMLQSAKDEATAILTRARDQATSIVSGARNEQARLEEASRQKGLVAARDEAARESLAKIQGAIDTLEAAASDLRAKKLEFLRSAGEGMVEIIAMILERIVRGSIVCDATLVRRTIDEAIKELSSADRITLRIHPDDLVSVKEYQNEIMSKVESLSDITITPDGGISRGGVIIETAFGRIDARLETQLSEILRTLAVEVKAGA